MYRQSTPAMYLRMANVGYAKWRRLIGNGTTKANLVSLALVL